jgi:hypothetical protein
MKAIKLISVLLILTTLCCTFIACDQGSIDDIELPARPFYDMTVSFQIKNANGKTIIDAVDYNYKGHEEPTILNIISDYLVIVADYKCTIDKNNTLVQVGGLKASVSKGEYWAFMEGTDLDISKLIADKEFDKKLIDTKMSEYNVLEENEKKKADGKPECFNFTIILVTAS